MKLPAARVIFLAIFVTCTAMMLVGAYMEHTLGLEPCPLCITQRVFIVLCGLIGLAGAIHAPVGNSRKIYSGLVAASALGGSVFSTRQLWLQSLPPDQAPACGPSVGYIFQTFPVGEALSILMRGDGNCAEVVWSLLGLSIPGWTLIGFACLAVLGLLAGLRAVAS